MNIVIPAAGEGKRFKDAGYDKPKPLIDVCGLPMIQRVLNCLPKSRTILLVNEQTFAYELPVETKLLVEQVTQGAACTVLLAEHVINNDDRLLIANCDQLVDYDIQGFIDRCDAAEAAGGVLTFNSTNPHHSYVKTNKYFITQVAEKQVISDQAVLGIYYWRHGSDFVKYATQMIAKDIRVNGEFYISPVYHEAIATDGRLFMAEDVPVNQKHMLGTPDELRIFEDKVFDGRVRL